MKNKTFIILGHTADITRVLQESFRRFQHHIGGKLIEYVSRTKSYFLNTSFSFQLEMLQVEQILSVLLLTFHPRRMPFVTVIATLVYTSITMRNVMILR